MYASHANGPHARLLCDKPVLLLDDGARRGIAIEATQDFARHSAIGPLRTVLVNHVEKREFNSRRRLPRHCWFPVLFNDGHTGRAPATPIGRPCRTPRSLARPTSTRLLRRALGEANKGQAILEHAHIWGYQV